MHTLNDLKERARNIWGLSPDVVLTNEWLIKEIQRREAMPIDRPNSFRLEFHGKETT